jgi:hypothetical protein
MPPAASEYCPQSRRGDWSRRNLLLLGGLSLFAFLIMGYHPGLEDDSFYLAAIKRDLNPALFPGDSDFFRIQFQATIFDNLIAFSVRLTHLALPWVVVLWQFAAVFFLLQGCWRVSRRCFAQPEAQWAATAMIAALLTLPVTATAINLMDQYLHPRALATAAIVAAIVAVIDRHFWLAGILLCVALVVHALMTAFGISFCLFLYWRLHAPKWRPSPVPLAAAFLIPLGWIFEPASEAWHQAAATRESYFLSRWEWYEWLGVYAPLILLFLGQRFLSSAKKTSENSALLPLMSAVFYYGLFQTIVGLAVMLPPGFERLRPFEPMRYLHLVYLFFFLIAGGLLGEFVLGRRLYRWGLLFLPLSAGMFYAQRRLYSASPHLELPFVAPHNGWLEAFAWIRVNTPRNSEFAIDPHYETLPAEDYHGFRGLAERGVLADYEKDAGMVCRVPSLAPRWLKEVTALEGWRNFQSPDFLRLKHDFGVSWVVLSRADAQFAVADPKDMSCPFAHRDVKVCRLY